MTRSSSRLATKGVVVLFALFGAGGLLVSGFRPWVTGAVDDAVLGATRISATGAEVAPGLSAVALAIAAAAIAAVAAGRIARIIALVAYAASVAVAVALTVRVLLDPEGALGPVAASRVGRTGTIENVADPTVWPWVALAASAVALLGLVGAVLGIRAWAGPSARYEVADTGSGVAGPRGERVASAWDELSAGRDPTDVGPDSHT
ncbi:MAG TPA: Trp biosynthesis-associated membrane protein [Ornithinibacter sp.]|nr:Trp biosynthesis-associated membrane protein [Ornithinibacter sp.]